MKVLVTGGAGFVGSHLVEELVKEKNVVHVVDDLSEGKWSNLSEARDKIFFYRQDIRNALPEIDFDVVYHLAAKHSVPKSFEHPQDYFDVNVGGSWDVFAQYQKSRIVNISSSSAKECKSPYAISKKTTELCAALFSGIVSLRYFNVIGERQPNKGCVVPSFCTEMLAGNPPIIYGDGSQSRDYTYVKDVVRETIGFGQGKRKKDVGVFDVGYGDSHTTMEMFKRIAKLLGYEGAPVFAGERLGDVKFTKSGKAIACPEFGFERGLERTVKWFEEKGVLK